MKTKTFSARVKAADDDSGTFEALVSVFGNVDHANDRVVKGAFADSIKRWKSSGDPIPVVFSHMWDDLDAHIGEVVEVEERDEGLYVKAQLDVDDDPSAAKVHRLLSKRRIREFSFAYDVIREKRADDGANDLLELDVIEVGPTLKGMNPDTVLIGAKRRQREKVYVPLVGSVEQRQQALREAVRAGAAGAAAGEDVWAYVEATFDDDVVFSVEQAEGMTHYQAPYSVNDDGEVTLGDPVKVELEATIRAASRGVKADIGLSAEQETQLREALDAAIGSVFTSTDDPADAGDGAKQTANDEAPAGGKSQEPAVRSPSDIRLSAELDLLSDIA